MSISLFANRKKPAKIAQLELDASLNENHRRENVISDYPVESGSNITDHVRNQPVILQMTGFVTNSPVPILDLGVDKLKESLSNVGDEVSSKVISRDKFERTTVARDLLLDYWKNGTLLDIDTNFFVYTNMVIESLLVPRNATIGDAMRFEATFKQIRFVSSETVELPNVDDLNGRAPNIDKQAQNKIDGGKETTTDLPEEEKDIALLYQLITGIKEFIGK